ncbi:hypothetical protein [Gordonibacter massiliensis (ex Traore et al. 2017)]|uniref:hypothetical protein n=1 Tax=Gordonibacter massiliensis (ex Traore et al. 2017) TaxID=1841863 RepID=UPI001C8BA68D|nr:hypothetical protein [Gordonibacter massiliensis (ex Traore et al. 2017)]MBX9034643.1 hypothetical protein [Gordonibacter massiliensis (ex Traore et al. 2017)]
MVLTEQEEKKGLAQGKTKRVLVSLVAAVALTMSLAIPAFAVGGQMQSPYSASGGVTDSSGAYLVDVDSTAFTAPSKFWGFNSMDGGPGSFAVHFENAANNSSMSFDMANAHAGVAAYGPLYTDGSSSGTPGSYVGNITTDPAEAADVWSGDWVYAFRVCPSATFGTDPSGNAAVGFNWKGCFGTYFDTWDFSFNAASVLGDSAKGAEITLTYYGGYVASQTSRGTSYGADLASTATDLSYGSTTAGATVNTPDTPVGTSYTATADAEGNVTFHGIVYGGNYTIS